MAALETVLEDTEAELARLKRSNVANMVKMYQSERPQQHKMDSARALSL